MDRSFVKMDVLLPALRDELAADDTLNAWVANTFSDRPLTIYLGFDPRKDGNTEAEYPMVAILSSQNGRSDHHGDLSYSIDIGVAVYNADRTVSGNIVTYEGFLQVEALRQQVEDALFRARIQYGIDVDGGYDREESQHPNHVSYIIITPKGMKNYSSRLPN